LEKISRIGYPTRIYHHRTNDIKTKLITCTHTLKEKEKTITVKILPKNPPPAQGCQVRKS